MAIDKELISKLELLARLQLDPAEREGFVADLNEILAMIDQLKSLDTEEVEPLVFMTEEENIFRPDEIADFYAAAALRNAPMTDGSFFKVPNVLSYSFHDPKHRSKK